jgi:hypothetical protein
MRATLLVRYREEIIATVTTNIRQYHMFVGTVDILSSLDLTSSFVLILC